MEGLMQITTLPVYSKLADPTTIPDVIARRLPADRQLSEHQLRTYEALNEPDVAVVINTAMTGDGKSLAGLLPLLVQRRPTLALFPTNELIQDQFAAAETMFDTWNASAGRAATLYGARLDELYADAEQLSRPEVLLRELHNHPLVLSNPDILHAILQFYYQQYGRDPSRVASDTALLFDQLTFDEFHIFDVPQVVAVLSGLLFLATQRPQLKALFLSATPEGALVPLLQKVGLGERLRLIQPQREGWYHHGSDPGPGWRPILQGSTLTFAPQSAEEWIEQGVEALLLPWFRIHGRGAKAALIVNSVATALRLVEQLKPLLAAEGLTVEPNTGLTGRSTRKRSYEADLLVGTSTVDVGVDFKINLLIFESPSASAFLQRLGRLGRHTSYTDRDGQEHHFPAFAAHALVPRFVYERLTANDTNQSPLLADGATLTREALATAIQQAFPPPARFDHYTRLWGRFVPAKVYQTLGRKELRATFASAREQLKLRYWELTSASMPKTLNEWEEYRKRGEERLVVEAQGFRGGSSFDCGVLKQGEDEPLTYDLFWLLANVQLELLSREQFCAEVVRMGCSDKPFRRGFQRCFFRWLGLRERREPLTVLLPATVAAWGPERHGVAVVLPSIGIDCAGHEFLPRLNAELRDADCAGLMVPGYEPRQLQRQFYLPPSVPLWPFQADSADSGTQRGTVAFGRAALLLDSRLRFKRVGDGNAPVFC
jgi:CRISPR-associated endonuclease/helicase Cas3